MRKKSFDCVEMKRKGARKVYEATKDMTVKEEVAYWRHRTAEIRKRLESLQNGTRAKKSAAR
ncbi:MAG TPA: hypothetical protein PLI09_10270 [Candidatus Hydrogenedentes bacterium]|nr:hypothetical protein [Candidatus Hydrogenedentota bacterium]